MKGQREIYKLRRERKKKILVNATYVRIYVFQQDLIV